jgi:hypothetical protein
MDRYENQQFLQRELQKGLKDAYSLMQAEEHWDAIEELQKWEAKWDRIISVRGSKIPPACERYLSALYCQCFKYGPIVHRHAVELVQDTLQEHPPQTTHVFISTMLLSQVCHSQCLRPNTAAFHSWISDPNVAINYAKALKHSDAVVQTAVCDKAPTPSPDTDAVPLS